MDLTITVKRIKFKKVTNGRSYSSCGYAAGTENDRSAAEL